MEANDFLANRTSFQSSLIMRENLNLIFIHRFHLPVFAETSETSLSKVDTF